MALNLLIVEDDANTRSILKKILSEDYNLTCCASGEDALEHLISNVPDLILLDIVLPGKNGYEISLEIKKDNRFSFTKILMVSSNPTVEDRIKAYDSGAHDYILKPFASAELKAKIDTFAELTKSQKKLKQMNHILQQEINHKIQDAIKQERMAIIGMNTAEIIHDLNNPLSAIKGTIELIKTDQPINERTLSRLRRALDNVYGIVSSILGSTRNITQSTEQIICVNEIIKSEIEIFKLKNKRSINIESDFGNVAPTIAIRSDLSQVFANLLQNAFDALLDSKEKKIWIRTYELDECLMISIKDSGQGMNKDVKAKIFEPFFTTKQGNETLPNRPTGTGLGLPSVQKIISNHKGKICVESQEGKGTEFTISFPINLPCSMIHQLKKVC